MGGLLSRPSVDTSAQNASLQRQERLLQEQQQRLDAQDADMRLREDSATRLRAARMRGRGLLLGGAETGTEDQPMPAQGLQQRLGG